MSLQERDYEIIFSYLRYLNFHYLNDWVVQCVNYCKSTNPNITIEEIKRIVKEQWLLVNLRSIQVPALPPNLGRIHKTILPGKYMVQVETMIDCSRSCYSQFQEIQRIDLDSVKETSEKNEWNIKSSRCLVFTITDGVQELKAMEFQPIKKIRTNDPELLPGFKMLIIGPVECRKGMLLLKEENVVIHGGEVDTLTVTNSLRSVLMRKLDLNEEDYPEIITQTVQDERREPSQMPEIYNTSNINGGTHVETLLSQNDDLFLTVPLESETLAQQGSLSNSIPLTGPRNGLNGADCSPGMSNLESDDLKFDNITIENLLDDSFLRVYKKHDLPPEEKATPSPKKICDRDGKEQIMNYMTAPHSSVSSKTAPDGLHYGAFFKSNEVMSNSNNSTCDDRMKQSGQTTISSFFKSSRLTDDLSCNQPLSKSKFTLQDQPFSISSEPFIYLKQTLQLQRPSLHTIKGTILTLKNKITLEKDEYKLVGTITDGSLSVDARFSSDVIESILGYSPCEMHEMMKLKQYNSAVADRIRQAFKKAQEKFISLNALMKIKFFNNSDPPVIMSLEEVSIEHLKALKERISSLNS